MSSDCGQPDAKFCLWCNGISDTAANPLLTLVAEGEDQPEYIHQCCVDRSDEFGFCWCCGPSKVFRREDLNAAEECEIHEGEAVPDYPEEDAESFVENVRNNE